MDFLEFFFATFFCFKTKESRSLAARSGEKKTKMMK